MSSPRQPGGSTLALSRTERRDEDEAEVIDLVHLPRGTRPTPIAYLDVEEVDRLRILSCDFYADCLAFAAEVRWRSFHCRQCPQNPARKSSAPEPVSSDDASIIELR